MKNMLHEDIDKKIAEARNAALEEAAMAAEAHDVIDRDMARRIAAAIRALKEADDA